jgi:hypothetical protein
LQYARHTAEYITNASASLLSLNLEESGIRVRWGLGHLKGLISESKTKLTHPFRFFNGSIFTRNTLTKKSRIKKMTSKTIALLIAKTCVEDGRVTKGNDKAPGGRISINNTKNKRLALKNHTSQILEKNFTSQPA